MEHAQRSAHDSEQREPTTERPVPHSPLVHSNDTLINSLDTSTATWPSVTRLRCTRASEANNGAVARAECSRVQACDKLAPTNCRGYRVDAVLARELRCGGPQWATSERGRWGNMGAIGRFGLLGGERAAWLPQHMGNTRLSHS